MAKYKVQTNGYSDQTRIYLKKSLEILIPNILKDCFQ